MATIVIHATTHKGREIHAVGEQLTYESPPRMAGDQQQAYITFSIEWDEGQGRAGPFKVPIDHPREDEENHYEIVFLYNVKPWKPGMRPGQIGLRVRNGRIVRWAEPISPRTRIVHNVWASIGDTAPEHVSLLVQPRMISAAVSFFVDQLGWREDQKRQTIADWGTVRFVCPRVGKVVVQLTELTGMETPVILSGVHLGLKTGNPDFAAAIIQQWAGSCGIPCEIEEVSGGKRSISLYTIFTTELELVPA